MTCATVDERWPATPLAWRMVSFLTFAFAVSYMERTVLALLIEPIKRDFHLSDVQIGILNGLAFVLFYVFFGIAMGRLVDTRRRIGIVGCSIAAWSVATALCGLAKGFRGLFAARVGVGIGEAGISPAAYSLISDCFPEESRPKAVATYSIGLYIGSGSAFVLGGVLAETGGRIPTVTLPIIGTMYGWQWIFVAIGIVPGAILLVLSPRWEPMRHYAQRGIIEVPVRTAEVMRYLLRNRAFFVCHFLGFSLLAMFMAATMTWAPAFFHRIYGTPLGRVGASLGMALAVFGALGCLFAGRFARFFDTTGSGRGTMCACATATFALAIPAVLAYFMPTENCTIVFLCAAFFLYAIPVSLAPAVLQAVVPNRMRGQVTALYLFVASAIGLAGGPLAVGMLSDDLFHNEQAVGHSLALVASSAVPSALLFLTLGTRALAFNRAPKAGLISSSRPT